MENFRQHMNERYHVVSDPDGTFSIKTVETEWRICNACRDLPQDPTGRFALQALCFEHNTAIDAKQPLTPLTRWGKLKLSWGFPPLAVRPQV